MHIKKCFIAIALYLFTITSIVSAQNVNSLAKKTLSATVLLETLDITGKPIGISSAFFVKQNTIVTNYRSLQGAATGSIKHVGKHKLRSIEGVLATDKQNDLALLKVSDYESKALPLIENSDTIKVGDKVYVAAHPKGLDGTLSTGIISTKDKRLVMTATIPPRSSGGPVLNAVGEVIGVSLSRHENGQDINTVIPANALKKLLAQTNHLTPIKRVNIPITADTYLQWGHEKYQQGQYKEAILDWTMVLHLDHDNVAEAYNNRGRAKAKLGQHFDAIADYNTALKLDTDYARAYNNRGVAKMKLGHKKSALQDYDRAIKLKPDNATFYDNRGVAKEKVGHYESAIQDYDRAIKLNPNYALAYTQRGIAKARLEQYDLAIVDYDTALRLNPNNATAYTQRGIAKVAIGQYDLAMIDYDTAIKLNPNYALAYTQRGILKEILGKYLHAVADYDTALRLKPGNSIAYYKRGIVRTILGYATDGRHDINIALRYATEAGDAKLEATIKHAVAQINQHRE